MPRCPICAFPIDKGKYCGRCGGRLVESENPSLEQKPPTDVKNQPTLSPQQTPPSPPAIQPVVSPAQTDIDKLSEELEDNPSSCQGYINLGEAQMLAGKMERAFSTYRAVKSIAPEAPNVHRFGAKILEALGRREEAIEALTKILALESDDIEAALQLAKLLHESGKRQKALERLQSLRERSRERPEVLLRLAAVQLSLGDAAAAQSDLSSYRKLAGETRDMFLLLGKAMMAQSFFDGAIRHYREALNTFPDDVELRLGLGKAYLGANERGQALMEFERGLMTAPNKIELLVEMGKLYGGMGMEDKTEEMFDRIRKQNVRNGEVFLEIGIYYKDRRFPRNALTELERAHECSPHNPDIVKIYCEVLESEHETAKALQEYETFLESVPFTTWALDGIIRCAKSLSEFARVAKAQRAFIDSGNQTSDAWCDYGETLIRLSNFTDAEKAFESAAKLDPSCVRAYQAPELIRIEKARAEGDKLVQQAKDAVSKRFFLTAIERLERALELVPRETSWMRILAEICLKTGSMLRASELLSKVRAAEPQDFWVSFQLARVYESEEKTQLAIELLSSILKDHPLELNAQIMLIRLKRSQIQGDRLEREMVNAQIRNINADLTGYRKTSPIPLLVEGFVNFIFGMGTKLQSETLKKAGELFEETLYKFGDQIWAHRGLSLVFRVSGDIKKSAHHLQEAVKLSSDPIALYSLARLNENFQLHSEAKKCYVSLRNLFPENGLYRKKVVELIAKETDAGNKSELMDFLGICQEKLKSESHQPWTLYEMACTQTHIAKRAPQRDEWVKRALLTWNKAAALPDVSPWIRWGLMEAQLEFLKGTDRQRTLNQNLKVCEKISRELPDIPFAHFYMGVCFLGFDDLTQTDRAVKHLEIGSFLAPDSTDILLVLAKTYRTLGKSVRVDAVRYNMILLEPELLLKI